MEEATRYWEENIEGHPLRDGSDPGCRQSLCGATGDASYQFQFNPEAAASGNTSQVHSDGSASWMKREYDGGNVCIQPGERPSYPSTAYVADMGQRADIVSYSHTHRPGEEYQPGAHREMVDYPPTGRTEQCPNIVSDPYAHRPGEGYQPGAHRERVDYPPTGRTEQCPNIVSDPYAYRPGEGYQPGAHRERVDYPPTGRTEQCPNIVSDPYAHRPGEGYQPGAHRERVDYPPTGRTEQCPNIGSDPDAHRPGEGYQPGFDYPETAYVEGAEQRPNIVSDPCTRADIMATRSSRLRRPLPHHSRRRAPKRKANTQGLRRKITKPCLQRPRTLKKLAVSAGRQIGTLPPGTLTEELCITNPRSTLKRGRSAWACGVDGCSQVLSAKDACRQHMLTHFDLHIVCFGCNHSFETSMKLKRHIGHVFKSDKTGPCVQSNPSMGKWVQKSGKSHYNGTNSWEEDSFIENPTLIEKGSEFDGGVRFVRVKWVDARGLRI
jgi:hypothetical protein